jgi:hypothetical protein
VGSDGGTPPCALLSPGVSIVGGIHVAIAGHPGISSDKKCGGQIKKKSLSYVEWRNPLLNKPPIRKIVGSFVVPFMTKALA